MFRSCTNEFKCNLSDKLDISEIIDIFTSGYGKYAKPVPDVGNHMNFLSGIFSIIT